MKNSLRIHKWTHNEFNIFILGVLTHPRVIHIIPKSRELILLRRDIKNAGRTNYSLAHT